MASSTPAPAPPEAARPASASPGRRAWRRFRHNRPASAGAGALLAMIALALLVPWLSPHTPEGITDTLSAAPGWQHWFGTDANGRDVFTRVFAGARISLLVGAVGAGVSLVIGVAWGAIAGYLGGRWDNLLMRIVDILYALPTIIFVIVLLTALNGLLETLRQSGWSGEGTRLLHLIGLFAGLGAVSWLTMARIVRGQVLSLRHRPFVEASLALGASHARILRRHILPNIVGVVIVYVALAVPSVVLYESFLSYLGLGIQPPAASLGSLIAEGAAQINSLRINWWLIVFPAGVLAVTLLALNFLGDGLRDALDPRAEG